MQSGRRARRPAYVNLGAAAPGFQNAARLRGEKKNIVFTSCSEGRRLEVPHCFWAGVATPRRSREGGHGVAAAVEIQGQMKTTTFLSNTPKRSVRTVAEICRRLKIMGKEARERLLSVDPSDARTTIQAMRGQRSKRCANLTSIVIRTSLQSSFRLHFNRKTATALGVRSGRLARHLS